MTTKESNLTEHLRAFVDSHPEGWTHTEWLGLLEKLQRAGITQDADQIGWTLENVRLESTLRGARLRGLGPKRIDAVVERFGTLYRLRQASAEQIAEIDIIHQSLADELHQALN